jgi:hypothetical protein
MKQVRFFAIDSDILSVLNEVEEGMDLQYVKTGLFSSPPTEHFDTGVNLPRLGMATSDSATNSESFLVTERGTSIHPRSIRLQNGGINFCIDQLNNPDTIVFTPAGRWESVAVLYGTFGTASDSDASLKLMKAFERAIKKNFKKIKAFWVGPNALLQLQKGGRLTIAIQSPKVFDLSL